MSEMLGGPGVVPAALRNDGEGLAWARRGLGLLPFPAAASAAPPSTTAAVAAAPWDATLPCSPFGDTVRALLQLEPDSRILARSAATGPGLMGWVAMKPILTNAPGFRGPFSLVQAPVDPALL